MVLIRTLFPGLEARAGRLVGVLTLIAALAVAGTGIDAGNIRFVLAAIVIAGAALFPLRASRENISGLRGFGRRLAYFALLFVAVIVSGVGG